MSETVFMFSGQGSQYYNMGRQLYENNNRFRFHFDRLDKEYERFAEHYLKPRLFVDSNVSRGLFDRLIHSHPAIVMVELALANALIDYDIIPDIVIGSSLGEFSALSIAGVIDSEDALYCSIKQAQWIENTSEEACMIAVVHSRSLIVHLKDVIDDFELIAVNAGESFVISVHCLEVDSLRSWFKENKIAHFVLPVKYGFHSKFIGSAEAGFCEDVATVRLNKPTLKIVSSIFVEFMQDYYTKYFWDVIRQPIQFAPALRLCGDKQDSIYVDLGQSGTLSSIAKQVLGPSVVKRTRTLMLPMGSDVNRFSTIQNSRIDNSKGRI